MYKYLKSKNSNVTKNAYAIPTDNFEHFAFRKFFSQIVFKFWHLFLLIILALATNYGSKSDFLIHPSI